ncbi:MAG: intradiol ring-cleavage dioxygenase, partial [Chloroflexota bacterium]|nr:intradiol ring-cleavage dioxygenase [Chloroflexota bacterium]
MTIQPQDDDAPVGRVLTRREVLTLLGAGTGAALLAACVPGALASPSSSASASAAAAASATASSSGEAGGVPSCIVRPELTEGPYYVDEELN